MLKPILLCLLALLATQDPRDAPDTVDLKAETIALHPEVMTCFAVDAKGEVLYSADAKNSLRAWDIKKGEFLWETDAMAGLAPIRELSVAGKLLITFLGEWTYQLWSLKDGSASEGATDAPMEGAASCMVADPRGKWLWLGNSAGGALRLQPGDQEGYSHYPDTNLGTFALALDSKAKQLAMGGGDGTVRFRNPSSTKADEENVIKVHTSRVTALTFGGKGKVLAVGAEDGTLRLIELKKGAELIEFEGHKVQVSKLAIDPKGRWLVSGDIEGNLFMWNLEDGRQPATLGVRARGPVAGIHFIGKGDTLLTTSGNQSVQVWDLSKLEE